jgi:hypothetical protein
MMMRYHFGLGVGHVFSHYRTPPVHVAVSPDSRDLGENTEVEGGNEVEDSESEDDEPMVDYAEQSGSSTESLNEFEGMYDFELDVDYEN